MNSGTSSKSDAQPAISRATVDVPKPILSKKARAVRGKKSDTAPAITEKDMKLLWGRSGNRCAFPGCPNQLTMDSSAGDASTLGEMAHIVGEEDSAKSPRGKSALPLNARNIYSNLILLCAHHHTIIDKRENWSDYSVEILHQMKDAHEQRVRESLAAKSHSEAIDPSELLVADIVDRCTRGFFLERWEWYADAAVRQILPEEIDNSDDMIARLILGTPWPRKLPELKMVTLRTAKSFIEFVRHTRDGAVLRGGFYKPDASYKRFGSYEKVSAARAEMNRWYQLSFLLFQRHVCYLNAFARTVRKHLNPMYFLAHGDSLLKDELGVWHDGESMIWKPTLKPLELAISVMGYRYPYVAGLLPPCSGG